MASIVNADNGVVSGAAGLKLSSDTTGILNLQTNGTTAISVSASQVVSFPATTTLDFSGTVTLSGGTANGVTYLNGSKALTSGSALVFDGSNLGVGVTPSAWSGRLAVQVNSSSFVGASDRLQLYQNSYFDGSAFKYIGSNFASLYNQVSGQHIWFTAPSGTAGNSITFTQAMTLDASGNLGIGTSSPIAKLDVRGQIYTAAATPQIQFTDTDNNADAYIQATDGNLRFFADDNGEAASSLISWAVDGSEKMRLDSSGNLGIGTSSPGAKAEIYVTRTSSTNAVSLILNDNVTGIQTNGVYKAIRSVSNGGGAVSEIRFMETDGTNNNTSISFATQSTANALTERLRIDQNGNLGLGVTPSAWSPQKAMQIASYTALADNPQGGGGFGLSSNAYEYSSGAYKYLQNYYATLYRTWAGQHQWYTAPSGTAGNTISFTQAMTLDASGQLGIGTTSPGALLHVYTGTQESVRFARNSTNSSAYVTFYANNSSSAQVQYAGILGDVASSTAGSHGGNLLFYTTGSGTSAERARITSGGNFLVGSTSSSTNQFQVNKAGDQVIYFTNINSSDPYGIYISYPNLTPNNTANYFISCQDSTANRMRVNSNGGIANYQANNINLSDQRVKKDVKPLGSMWDKFKAIEIVTFKYKDQSHDDDNIGVIAQQVESVAPEFVDADGWGETPEDGVPLKTVYTTDMYHAAIKALQEAMSRIEKLEAEVSALKGV